MGYHLCQVGSLLKKAYDHAKKQLGEDFFYKNQDGIYVRGRMVGYGPDGYKTRRIDPKAVDERFNMEKIPRVKAGSDIGHELAMVKASSIMIAELAKAFSMSIYADVLTDEYQVFFLRATWYLNLRGISVAAIHQKETEKYYYYEDSRGKIRYTDDPKGHGVQTGTRRLTLIEESLRYAGIPLHEPLIRRSVDAQYGIIWAPVDGKVKDSYVQGKYGRLPVVPRSPLFLLEQWVKPSISREVTVIADVGGEVGKVSVKPGKLVNKGDELLRLKDPWVYVSLALPCGAQFSSSSYTVKG